MMIQKIKKMLIRCQLLNLIVFILCGIIAMTNRNVTILFFSVVGILVCVIAITANVIDLRKYKKRGGKHYEADTKLSEVQKGMPKGRY